MYYDCGRNSNGSSYTTTTKKTTTKKRTTKTTTTTTNTTITTASTTTAIVENPKLKYLNLSDGKITFDPNNYDYSITVDADVNNITVTAVPEDNNSRVEVKGNNNIVDGGIIFIFVTSDNGSVSEYKINVKKSVKLSSNAHLKSLTVTEYSELNFSSNINDYTIVIDEDVKTLNIDYKEEDDKATVIVQGNENLANGSKITITVSAEDGTVNYYYINILVKAKSNFLGILFIIILIIAVLAGGYYLYKKFVKSKEGDKYEYE